jgi:hypothetical protein
MMAIMGRMMRSALPANGSIASSQFASVRLENDCNRPSMVRATRFNSHARPNNVPAPRIQSSTSRPRVSHGVAG